MQKHDLENPQLQVDRRQFARQLAIGTGCVTAGLAAMGTLGAQIPPAPKLPEDSDPAPVPGQPPEAPEAPPAELVLLTYLIQRYPSDRFDDEALRGIFRDIQGDQARGELLAKFALKNSDEPAFVFNPFRGTGRIPVDV
jgi:hypothetical protein